MKNSETIYWRKAVAQEIDKFYYEPHNSARCHRQGYERFGKFLCAVGYPTYMRYLKAVVPAEYGLPPRIVNGIRRMILSDGEYPSLLDEEEVRLHQGR